MTAQKTDRAARIVAELRKKYTPREVLKALGLDESLLDVPKLALDGAKTMKKPTRLEYLLVTRTAKAINPLLAHDKKVEYGPIFAGITTKNFKDRRPKIVADIKKAIKGNTIAKDASVEHLAHMLDQFEHEPAHEVLDESVSGSQHRAMEAAAHGTSNIGIPKSVGQEFSDADKGKHFSDAMPAFLREKGMSEDDIKHVMDMLPKDEMPENALDEEEEEEEREAEDHDAEDHEREGEDESEAEREEEAEDESEEEREREAKDHRAKDHRAKDHKAKDRKGAMDKKTVTVDEMNKAITAAVAAANKANAATQDAREFVRPYVGEVSMALDSAEKILRAAAGVLGIEEAESVHPSALKTIIKTVGHAKAMQTQTEHLMAQDQAHVAADGASSTSFDQFFPNAARIKAA